MTYTVEAACSCHKGRIRTLNQDNFYFGGRCLEVDNNGLRNPDYLEISSQSRPNLAIFDGMGGGDFGEIAAFTAAWQMKKTEQIRSDFAIPEKEYLKRLVSELNDAVLAAKHRLRTFHMGTTMVALYFAPRYAYICNVGDSRAYRLRDNVFMQISRDHVDRMAGVQKGKAPLTQYLGMDTTETIMEPYIAKGELQIGDRYLLCSDGLYDMLSNCEIAEILISCKDAVNTVQALINAALEKGGRDNITVAICDIRE